jgi:hypothetical protein
MRSHCDPLGSRPLRLPPNPAAQRTINQSLPACKELLSDFKIVIQRIDGSAGQPYPYGCLSGNDTLAITGDGFFATPAFIIGPWPADGRASRSKSSNRLPIHRSSRNNDLRLNKWLCSRSRQRLHCPVDVSFSNSRRSRIRVTGKCLRSPCQNWTSVSHAWAKSMVWLSLNISEV